MSNERISIPRHDLALALGTQEEGVTPYLQKRAGDRLRALLAKPGDLGQEKVELERITDAYRTELDELAQRNYDLRFKHAAQHQAERFTYSSKQATNCAGCGLRKHTPLRVDDMGGYVCLTCIDNRLGELLEAEQYQGEPVAMVRTHGSVCWEEITGESLELCQAQPEEYEVRTLYTHPAEQPENVVDLDALDWAEIQKAAGESPWIPPEYSRSDWVSDVCRFLRDTPAEQPEPVSPTSDQYRAELYDEVWQLARDMGFGNVTDALMKLKTQPAPVAVASDKQVVPVRRDWLEEWAMELVLAAQDGGTMSNQVEHLLQLHPKQ